MARATLTSPMSYSTGRSKYSTGSIGTTSTMSRRHTPTNRYTSTYNTSYASGGTSTYGAGTSSTRATGISTRSTGYGTTGNYSPSKYSSDKYTSTTDKYGTGTDKYGTDKYGTDKYSTDKYGSSDRYQDKYSEKYADKYSTVGGGGVSTLQKARDGLKPVSRPRALPPGPGPLDADGNKIDHKYASGTGSQYKPSTYSHRSQSLSRNLPLKADHTAAYAQARTYSPSVSSVGSNVDSPTPTGRLSRAKRTNSITDLSSALDNNLTITTSFSKSKRFGSQADLNHTSSLLHHGADKNYEKETITDEIGYTSRTTPRGKASYGVTGSSFDRDGDRDSGVLPDIHGAGTSTLGKSTSQDRVGGKKVDDSPVPRRKNSYDTSSRQNSNSSINTSGYSSRNSPDNTSGNRGNTGLRNLGNTCFMNSVLQCLSNTRLLLDYCLNDDYRDEINTSTSNMKGMLVKAFANLLRSMWKQSSDVVSPNDFKSQIARHAKRFVGYNQQDAQEFLIYLLEGLHEDVNRIKEKKKRIINDDCSEDRRSAAEQAKEAWKRYLDHDNSKIVDIFVGQLKSSLKCTVCGYVSMTFDPFWDLSLPIKKGSYGSGDPSLTDCFELFTQEETLEGDERPTCAKCKKRQKCTKGFTIQKFPKVLVIHLKRFNQESIYRAKLSTHVNCPLTSLDLTQFAAEKSAAPAVYNLYAVSNHSGTPFGGHYTACAKNPHSGKWHNFNDQRVSVIGESRVVSSEGYVLFYELAGTSSRL